MSGLAELAATVAGEAAGGLTTAITGGIGQQIGYGLGELTGYNRKLRNDQLTQQQKLTDIQSAANLGLMKESYAQQKQMWEDTNYEEQVAHLKEAGLNPALLYAKGGSGGTTGSGGASVGGGTASDETSRKMADIAATGMALQVGKLKSEIELNKALANKNNADAGLTTENKPNIIAETVERGKATWIENLKREFENQNVQGYNHPIYGQTEIDSKSLFNQQSVANLTKTMADSNNAEAQALLTNEKAQGYWQELLNETAKANATGIQAAAQKLAAEWNTGEMTNWKTWAELGKTVVDTAIKAIKP